MSDINIFYTLCIDIAARVESMAEAGGICISGRAYDRVANKLGLEYENLGEHRFKTSCYPNLPASCLQAYFCIMCATACSNPSMVSSNMGNISRMALIVRV